MNFNYWLMMLETVPDNEWVTMLKQSNGISNSLLTLPSNARAFLCVKLEDSHITDKALPFVFKLQNEGMAVNDTQFKKFINAPTLLHYIELLARIADDNLLIAIDDDEEQIQVKINKLKQIIGGING